MGVSLITSLVILFVRNTSPYSLSRLQFTIVRFLIFPPVLWRRRIKMQKKSTKSNLRNPTAMLARLVFSQWTAIPWQESITWRKEYFKSDIKAYRFFNNAWYQKRNTSSVPAVQLHGMRGNSGHGWRGGATHCFEADVSGNSPAGKKVWWIYIKSWCSRLLPWGLKINIRGIKPGKWYELHIISQA